MKRRIRNFEELARNDLRRDALSIAEAGYAAIDTSTALERNLRIEKDALHIKDHIYQIAGRKIFFVGIGKCSVAAAVTIEKILEDNLTSGIVFDVSNVNDISFKKIKTYIGTHPLPSETNEIATGKIIEFLSDCGENDLVIMLISGGGSTLLCLPENPMTCIDESNLFSKLTANGASIQDINTVRKHISRARGGGLAVAAYPAEVISLIISDVPKNDIEIVASGPTVLDNSTVADAKAILELYNIAPLTNIKYLETQKEQKYFERVSNIIFLTNQDALKAMREEAERRGYVPVIADDHFDGEASDMGRSITKTLRDTAPKTALLYAGESTVSIKKHPGTGGRNQEIALAALQNIDGNLILPFSSDGHDNTDHAGAICDEITREHARDLDLSIEGYLESHNTYDFFSASGDALITGYTGSNVSDLIVAIKK